MKGAQLGYMKLTNQACFSFNVCFLLCFKIIGSMSYAGFSLALSCC